MCLRQRGGVFFFWVGGGTEKLEKLFAVCVHPKPKMSVFDSIMTKISTPMRRLRRNQSISLASVKVNTSFRLKR